MNPINLPDTKFESWVLEDLKNSSLGYENFIIEPLRSETELGKRLGFTSIKNTDGTWVKIIEIGGYWIPYPNVLGYYRLKLKHTIETDNGKVKYLSPIKEMGFGNHAYILPEVFKIAATYKPDDHIFITEGEKKAAKATLEGFPTISIPGVWCFKDSSNDLLPELKGMNLKYKKCYICFDSDIKDKLNVRQAELRLIIELMNIGAEVYAIRLPGEQSGEKNGLDDFLVRYGRKRFNEFVMQSKKALETHLIEELPIKMFIHEISRLEDELHLDEAVKLTAKLHSYSVGALRKQVEKVRRSKKSEENNQEKKDQNPVVQYSESEIELAKNLIQKNTLLDDMLNQTEQIGFVGEELNKKVLFLACVSRLLNNSISVVVKGASASGKSALVKTVLKFFPESDVLSYSFITAKALVHSDINLDHKILFVQEHEGSQQADYSIRTMISESELSISLPIKDESTGNFRSIEKRISAKGLTFIETTTRERIHSENQTRVFDLYIDESEEQTERVLMAEAKEFGDKQETESKLNAWRCAMSDLKPYDVVIPFANVLAKVFPRNKIRVRRDFKRFLALIKAHALLHQHQRGKVGDNKVVATFTDLNAVLPLVGKVLSQSLKEYSPNQEGLVKTVQTNFPDTEFSFSELKEKCTNIHPRTLRRYIKVFENDGIVEWNGERGRKSRYGLNSSVPMSPFSEFTTKLQKLLNNERDSTELSEMSPKSSIIEDSDTMGHQRQNGMSSSKTNNLKELEQTTPNNDKGTTTQEDILRETEKEIEEYIEGLNRDE